MNGVNPTVRHMLLCDDAEAQQDHSNRWNVSGLMHALTFAADTNFPTHHPLLTVLLHLTGGRGSGAVNIVGVHADSEQVVFATPQRTIQFPNDRWPYTGWSSASWMSQSPSGDYTTSSSSTTNR